MFSTHRHRISILLFVLIAAALPVHADNVTVSGAVNFSSLDGSSLDHDGLANGTFTVSDGDLTVLGSINCNDDATRDACSMKFAVSGNLTVAAGGALYAENRRGNGTGGNISASVGGNLVVGGTISSGNLSVDRAGDITLTAGGSALLQSGSVISGSSKGSPAGKITVQSGGLLDVRGLVAAGPSSTVVATKYTGAVLNGGSSNSAGGAITLRSTSHSEPAITVSSDAVVVSQGENAGADAVVLEGCGINVNGLVASVSTAGAGAKVIIRSGTTASVDGRDLGGSGTRRGMLRADSVSQGAGTYSANIFSRSSVTVQGPASGALYAVNSSGGKTSKDPSGTVNVIATAGGITATGNAFAANGSNAGDQGGTINLSARDNVALTSANIDASGDSASGDASRAGGHVNVRSYSGAVTWLGGTGDVRPTGSASGVPAGQQGTISLTYCTTVSTSGTSFPTNGAPVGTFPTLTQSCSPAAPSLPSGESHPDCNDPPVAVNDGYTVAEGGTLNVAAPGVLTNDVDPDGDPITAILVSGPAHAASFTLNANGSFTYTHDGSETTSDSFTYKANDGQADSNVATVNITVTPVNDAPVAANDGPYPVAEGGTLNVAAPGVKANDTDPDGPSSTAVLVSGPAHASFFALNADGSFTYTHDGSETTSDSFTYKVNDGLADSNVATVTISITPVNDAPVAVNDGPYTVAEGGTLNGSSVLANDTDAEGNSLTAALVTGPAHAASFSFNADGTFTYVHDGSETTSDSFTYKANDGSLDSNVVSVSIVITPVNDAPTAVADNYSTFGNTELRVGIGPSATPAVTTSGSVLNNDSDPDAGPAPLTVNAFDATSANGGSISMNPNGSFNYLPPTGYTGTDTFNYTVTDGGSTSMATVTINISQRVWYVNAVAGATQSGRSTEPFATLGQAQIASFVNDYIHVAAGTYGSGVTLKNSQRLVGSGVPLVISAVTVAPATAAPALQGIINLASGNLVTGLNQSLSSTTQGILGSGISGGTISQVNVTGGFEALTLTGCSGTFTLTNVALAPNGDGLTIAGGSPTVTASNLDVVTTTGNGIFGNAGTLNISAGSDGSTVASAGGTAVDLTGMTLNVALRSVNAAGGASGVKLTGTSGSFSVTGDGSGNANGSGGSIANSTSRPVHMVGVAGSVSLKSMNLSLASSALSGMLVDNNAGGALSVTVTGCAFSGANSGSQSKALLQVEGGNTANLNANVQGSFFNNSFTYGFFATAAGTSSMNVTVNQSGFGTDVVTTGAANNPGTIITLPNTIGMAVTQGGSALVDYNVTNNTFWGANGSAGAIYAVTFSSAATGAGSHLSGTFAGNKIGKTGVVGSGCSAGCAGLGLLPGKAGLFSANVTGNDIRQVSARGVDYANTVSGATGSSVIKIKGNTIAEPDTVGSIRRAISVATGNSGGASSNVCAEIGGSAAGDQNVVSGTWQTGNFVRVTTNSTTGTLTLPGLTPTTGATAAQINAFIAANNVGVTGSVNTTVGGAIVGGAPCP